MLLHATKSWGVISISQNCVELYENFFKGLFMLSSDLSKDRNLNFPF